MRFLVVDGSHLAFRVIYASMSNDLFSSNYIKFLITKSIISEVCKYPSTPIVAFDYGGSDYRKSIYPEYKGDRKRDELPLIIDGKDMSDKDISADELIKIRRLLDNEDEIKTADNLINLKLFLETRDYVVNELGKIGILGFKSLGYEADDIGYLFSNCTNTEGRLLSDDNDWRLYLNDRYHLRRPIKDEVITIDDMSKEPMYSSMMESTGLSAPELYHHILALTGTHNNVVGYKGIGETRAAKLVPMILSGDEIKPGPAYINTYLEDKSRYKLNYKIIGSSHIRDDSSKLLSEIVTNYRNNVKRPGQIDMILLGGSIGSNTIGDMYSDYHKSIEILSEEELCHISQPSLIQ